jgi:pimeloyl-ACP methyl ester carboxylesterase
MVHGMINYERRGGGTPLLLIHGIGGDLCVWEPVLDRLAEQRDVIALDLPGFGGSPGLAAGVVPTPQALAASIGSLLDSLSIERAHIAGNSLGGWVGLELAVSGRALSVAGLCPAGLWDAPMIPAGASVRGRAHAVVRGLRPALPVLLRSRAARRLALGHVVADPDRVPYRAALRIVRSYARATAYDATNTAMRQNYFRDAAKLGVPVTLAFGERDRLIRPVRLETPWARSVLLPGCGHIPMWDAPELVGQVILDAELVSTRPGSPISA